MMMRSGEFYVLTASYAFSPPNFTSQLRKDYSAEIENLKRQVEHVQRSAQSDVARIRSRDEAEMSELKAKLASLELDLEKVCLDILCDVDHLTD